MKFNFIGIMRTWLHNVKRDLGSFWFFFFVPQSLWYSHYPHNILASVKGDSGMEGHKPYGLM